jgi:hypothetical protein
MSMPNKDGMAFAPSIGTLYIRYEYPYIAAGNDPMGTDRESHLSEITYSVSAVGTTLGAKKNNATRARGGRFSIAQHFRRPGW